MKFKKEYIEHFLETRDWKKTRSGTLFDYYTPPTSLKILDELELEIPKNEAKNGFEKYVSNLIDVVADIYSDAITKEDLVLFFSKDETIMSLRVWDDDTKDGSIELDRFSKEIDNVKLILKQTVTFLVSQKPIFGQSKFEAENFVKRCRALQTAKGSFVTKIELPSAPIQSTISSFDSKQVHAKLYEILDFTNQEIIKSRTPISIDKNYYNANTKYINIELLGSIRDLYNQAQINNVDFKFENNRALDYISFTAIKPRLRYFNKFISDLKTILLQDTPLEVVGVIKRLYSPSPQKFQKNEVVIEAEVANKVERVKVILNSKQYGEAIEAHKAESRVKVKGIAKMSQSYYNLSNPELFEIQ